MNRKIRIPFEIVIVLVALIPHLYAAFSPPASLMHWYRTDDAYYYFIVARNVAAGHGFTFDLINRTNGFHPLWLFLNIPIFAFTVGQKILPLRILVLLLAGLNAATGVLIFRLLKKYFLFGTAALISIVWVLLPRIHQVTTEDGLEGGLNAFALAALLLGGSWFLDRVNAEKQKRWDLVWVGLLAALALFSRLDNIFTFIAVGVWLVLRRFPFPRSLLLDELFIIFGIFGSAVLRFGFSASYVVALLSIFVMTVLAMVIFPVSHLIFRVYDRIPGKNRWIDFFRILLSTTTASLVLGFIMLGLNSLGIFRAFPRSLIVYSWAIISILVLGSRLIRPRAFNMQGKQFPAVWMTSTRQNWRRILVEGLKYFSPGAILMIFYMGWNQFYFGTAMPISGQVKHWWSTLPNTVYGHPIDLKAFLSLSPSQNYGPWSLVTNPLDGAINSLMERYNLMTDPIYWGLFLLSAGLILWGVVALFRAVRFDWLERSRRIGLHALLAGSILQISYYLATSYPNPRSWYWVGEMLAIILFAAVVLEAVTEFLIQHKFNERNILVLEYALMAILLLVNIRYLISLTPWQVPTGSEENYLSDARGLESLTPPGSIIGMPGGGTVAYFIEGRTIVNLDGLMNSVEYLNALQENRGMDFLDRLKMSFVNGNEYMVTSSDPYMGIFKGRLEKIGLIRGLEGFTLFKYRNTLQESE